MLAAPREHDLFAALCGSEAVRSLHAYGARGLDLTHLECARLARSLRDLAVRKEPTRSSSILALQGQEVAGSVVKLGGEPVLAGDV